MSFNSHRRKLLDESQPLKHRASHARSCAIHVGNKLGVHRDEVIERVARETGVNLHEPGSVAELLRAFEALEKIRKAADPAPKPGRGAAVTPAKGKGA